MNRLSPAPLPFGYHSVNPYIVVGREQGRETTPDGEIEHADVLIGDSLVMISEASDRFPARPCVHFVYVDDVDLVVERAVSRGAQALHSPTDQPWGDRIGGIIDAFQNRWWIATHQRDFS